MLNILKYRDGERSKKFASDAGSPEKTLYHGRVEPDGTITLVPDTVINVQQQIDSWEPSTDIYNIINNLGFDNLKPPADGFFDATDMPKNYAEMLQLFINGERAFERLPVEVKQKFDNDFNKWFASAGSDEWFEKCGFNLDVKPVVDPTPVPIKEEKSE